MIQNIKINLGTCYHLCYLAIKLPKTMVYDMNPSNNRYGSVFR